MLNAGVFTKRVLLIVSSFFFFTVAEGQNGSPLLPGENRTLDGSGNNLLNPAWGAPISLLERLNYSGVPGVTGNTLTRMAFLHLRVQGQETSVLAPSAICLEHSPDRFRTLAG